MEKLNSILLQMATQSTRNQREKAAFQPPGGGAPPMDPAAAGGTPPMDPMAAAGGMPPPAPGGMPPPAPGGMPPAPGMDPMAAMGGAPAQQKMKPEQMMQMLDFRLYNLQQQITALLNKLGVEVPAGALVTPPGSPTPVAEAAVPGGPQDPSMQPGAAQGGESAISPIEPMQGASPELAAGGAKAAGWNDYRIIAEPESLPSSFMRKAELTEFLKEANSQAPVGYKVLLIKASEGSKADISSTGGDVDEEGPSVSPPNKSLNVAGAPATTPSLRPHPGSTAGGSKDPKSETDGSMPEPKSAAQKFGEAVASDSLPLRSVGYPVENDVPQEKTSNLWGDAKTSTRASAVAALFRSRTQAGSHADNHS